MFLQKFTVTAPTATAFSALYNSVGVFTTNVPNARQWQFTFNGNFTSLERFEIIYDFSKVDSFGYSIRFEGNLNGFITCDKQIYACDKYIKYIPQTEEDVKNKIVRLLFKPPCPGQELVNRSLYYVVNLNDNAVSCNSKCSPNSGYINNYVATIIDGDTINSGNLQSQYTSSSTTICGHKENINGTTVVFLYFTEATNADDVSYWNFTNMKSGWVIQFINLTQLSSQQFYFSYQNDVNNSSTPISCSYNYSNFTDCTIAFIWNPNTYCFLSADATYDDLYPITTSTTC